jgi:hypothetical protein
MLYNAHKMSLTTSNYMVVAFVRTLDKTRQLYTTAKLPRLERQPRSMCLCQGRGPERFAGRPFTPKRAYLIALIISSSN